jgi:hypothetical protein
MKKEFYLYQNKGVESSDGIKISISTLDYHGDSTKLYERVIKEVQELLVNIHDYKGTDQEVMDKMVLETREFMDREFPNGKRTIIEIK